MKLDKERQISCDITICGILKNDTNQLIKNIDKLTDIENKHSY